MDAAEFEPEGGWRGRRGEGGGTGVRHERSWELHPACPQFIAKANPTPASKLASGIDQKTLTTLERALS